MDRPQVPARTIDRPYIEGGENSADRKLTHTVGAIRSSLRKDNWQPFKYLFAGHKRRKCSHRLDGFAVKLNASSFYSIS